MKTIIFAGLISAIFLVGSTTAQARPHIHHSVRHVTKVHSHRVIVNPAPRAVVVKSVSRTRVRALPIGHVRIVYAGSTYYHHNGLYYVREGADFVVITPSQGLRDVVIVKRV